jgi:hypothetical protein
MRRLFIVAVAAASILAAVSAANAGYWFNGVYLPSCYWLPVEKGPPVYVCY